MAARTFESLDLEQTVSLTTFRRNGLGVATPLWFARDGDRIYMRTIARSGKVKRLRNDERVTLAPCTWEGEITGPEVAGAGRVMDADEPAVLRADALLDAKYGEERAKMTRMMEEQNEPLLFLELRARDVEE
jgi:PPOX class probable F420-dependent enzyme